MRCASDAVGLLLLTAIYHRKKLYWNLNRFFNPVAPADPLGGEMMHSFYIIVSEDTTKAGSFVVECEGFRPDQENPVEFLIIGPDRQVSIGKRNTNIGISSMEMDCV